MSAYRTAATPESAPRLCECCGYPEDGMHHIDGRWQGETIECGNFVGGRNLMHSRSPRDVERARAVAEALAQLRAFPNPPIFVVAAIALLEAR